MIDVSRVCHHSWKDARNIMSDALNLLVVQSVKSIIKTEFQLLQSIIFPGREILCCHSPYCLLLHTVITPGVLNHCSFYIRVRELGIFGDEFISVTMLNGQCLHWCVHFSSMTQQFLTIQLASLQNVDFWQKTKSVISTIAFLKCQSPAAVDVSVHDARMSRFRAIFLSPYRNAAGPVLSGQDTPLPEQPCSKCPWLHTQEAWLTTLWHVTVLASMQRKSTNSISLIRASGILPSKPVYVSRPSPASLCSVWDG